ncbi:glycosyltransferase [Streptococcus suis]|uniref:Family 2 glycosyl transferase n=1 Tax=Streptococcus suis TaxID=1307 RepID=A0A1X9I283_STRSU|nr:glycosyltransferase [Streptococcus suis]AER15037.1 glycosyl transferase family protein [Streptococcus suis SS12]ANJ64223.1 family 2 glycosyl transferase [Streptococcus suis]MBL1181843.1 glycosyltransferase [Streptococcus suis]MBL1188970.1 glycosyltransferase [Streptococcus suis]MBL1190960.1 glycosyltransferase [Streptococcus suis]
MISIIIPIFNSESYLEKNILKIYEYFKKENLDFELILVNDGSTDNTRKYLYRISALLDNCNIVDYGDNMGKGFAIYAGIQKSKGDVFVIYDVDMSASLDSLHKLIEIQKKDKYDVVLGSRYITKIGINQSFIRRFSGKLFNFFVRALFKLPFSDTQCGCKVFSRRVHEVVSEGIEIQGFAFDVPLLEKLVLKKCTHIEVPILWNQGDTNFLIDTFVVFTIGPRMFIDILKYKFGYLEKKVISYESKNL